MGVTGVNIDLMLRLLKGVKLTHLELDNNFSRLKTAIEQHGHDTHFITITATEALGGHRVATVQGWYADRGNVSHAAAIAGITLQAVAAGSTVQVQRSGEIEESSWGWVLGQAVYLGASGQLTQTPPASGIVVVIGVPVSSTRLAIDIQPPIHMA